VTIALGMLCSDGAVLAADRQMTKEGGLKYEEKKYIISHVKGSIPLDYIFVYCGTPEVAHIFEERIGMALLDGVCSGNMFMPSMVIDNLKSVFGDKESRYIESLIAFGSPHIQPFIVRTKGNRVVRGRRECIGVGDSSVIRYLSDLLPKTLTVETALPICAYLVTLGNRYIEGCGFGPDVLFMGGARRVPMSVSEKEVESYASRFSGFERKLSEGLSFN
jgi:hypothetical protein